MSQAKTCPLMVAATISGVMSTWQPGDRVWIPKEAEHLLSCSRDGCALWTEGRGCGFRSSTKPPVGNRQPIRARGR